MRRRWVPATLVLVALLQAIPASAATVASTVETDPVTGTLDAADDPAIWIHPSDPAQSTVIATDKTGGGVIVYDLAGHTLQYDTTVKPNNVDLRYNFPLGGTAVTLVALSDKREAAIGLYRVNPFTRLLENVAARVIEPTINPKGICMYVSPVTGTTYVFVVASEGIVQQWRLFDDGAGRVDGALVRSFVINTTSPTGTVSEACVADDHHGYLYVSEERAAIWRYGAEPDAGDARTMIDTGDGSGHLDPDIEGLAIYQATGGGGYLIASSQNDDMFAVYDRVSGAYVGSFHVGAGATTDEVTHTDGIDVTNAPLGAGFPEGMFVAQDDENPGANQNFKLVPWGDIARSFSPSLAFDTTFDPRSIGGGGGGNRPPVVSAGPDANVLLGASASLEGRVIDDGLPSGTLSSAWSVQSAPAGATVGFADPSSPATTATFSAAGTYVLALTGDDGALSVTDTVTIGVTDGVAIDVPVAGGADDAEESSSGVVSLTSSDLELVFDGSNQTVGVRFRDLPIPAGANVSSASIQFETDETNTGTTTLTIAAHDVDSAPTFTTATGNISARARTDRSVSWTPPPWTTLQARGTEQRTPDLSEVVQEVVDRPGWTSGGAIAFVITGTGERTAEAFDGTSAPLLHLEFGMGDDPPPPPPPENMPPTVSAGPDREVVFPNAATLAGTAGDDGLPAPASLTTTWSQVSGPGAVTFGNAASPSTTATATQAGTYVLRLTAHDGELGASDTVTVTWRDTIAIDLRIATGNDDVEEKAGGSVKRGNDDLELVYDGGAQTIGLRFISVPIPAGATIVSAYVQFQVDEVRTGTPSLTVAGQAVNDAPAFTTTSGNVSTRARTAARVGWTPAPWPTVGQAGPDQRTPDLSPIIREIVGRAGWVSGNDLVLIITGGSGTARRVAESFEGNAAAAPLLHVEYR